MVNIVSIYVEDVRFPTSKDLTGSDAIHTDPDYSATYVTINTSEPKLKGFGIAFMEAASYGIGSIGGKDGGASDAISHNKTGLICDGNDLNSIYETITDFFKDEKFIKFGKEASEFSKNFHWNKIVKNYLKLIN